MPPGWRRAFSAVSFRAVLLLNIMAVYVYPYRAHDQYRQALIYGNPIVERCQLVANSRETPSSLKKGYEAVRICAN